MDLVYIPGTFCPAHPLPLDTNPIRTAYKKISLIQCLTSLRYLFHFPQPKEALHYLLGKYPVHQGSTPLHFFQQTLLPEISDCLLKKLKAQTTNQIFTIS